MSKASEKRAERDEAIDRLRKMLKPGDTVYGAVRHVSRSGMYRHIRLSVPYVGEDGKPDIANITGSAASALGWTWVDKTWSIGVGGCGMDMVFHTVYSLSRVLYPDGYDCVGEKCPSNDHSNAWNRVKNGTCLFCDATIRKVHNVFRYGTREYPVCGTHATTTVWHHRDGGYALVKRDL